MIRGENRATEGRRAVSDSWTPTDHAANQPGIQKHVSRGLTWTLIDNWAGQLLGLGIFVLILRLINAEDIGLVALAAAFVALTQLFVDQGLGDALIQRPTLTRRQIDTAFWSAVVTGGLLTVGGILGAGTISTIVGESRLEPILQVLSFSFLLVSLSSIQIALLRRELAFRSLAIRRLAAIVGGGVVGVALAYIGVGAWALVAQLLTQAAVSVVAVWTVSPWRPGFSVSWTDFRGLFSFGINIVAGDLLFYVSRNVDSLLIGSFLGLTPLGLYTVGHRFLDTSTALLIHAARRMVFPVFARLQHDVERLRRAYSRMNRALSAVTLPGYVGMALVAQEAIVVFVGEQWTASAPVAMVLVLVGPVVTLQAFSGGILNAVGHPEVTLRFRFLSTVVNVAGFLIAVLIFRDILAVAVAYVIRGYILVPLNLWWLHVYAGIPISKNLLQLRGVVAATALMAAAVVTVKWIMLSVAGPGPTLAAEFITGVVVYASALAVFDRSLLSELRNVVMRALPEGALAKGSGHRPRSRRPLAPPITAADEYDEA